MSLLSVEASGGRQSCSHEFAADRCFLCEVEQGGGLQSRIGEA